MYESRPLAIVGEHLLLHKSSIQWEECSCEEKNTKPAMVTLKHGVWSLSASRMRDELETYIHIFLRWVSWSTLVILVLGKQRQMLTGQTTQHSWWTLGFSDKLWEKQAELHWRTKLWGCSLDSSNIDVHQCAHMCTGTWEQHVFLLEIKCDSAAIVTVFHLVLIL